MTLYMDNITVIFMPGAAGNFLCRVLGLHSQIALGGVLAGTPADKFDVLNYNEVIDNNSLLEVWVKWEHKLGIFLTVQNSTSDTTQNKYSVVQLHPDTKILESPAPQIIIDSRNNNELRLKNAKHKQSGNKKLAGLLTDAYSLFLELSEIHSKLVINYIDFFDSAAFELVLLEIYKYLNLPVELYYQLKLHNQWLQTTIKPRNIQCTNVRTL